MLPASNNQEIIYNMFMNSGQNMEFSSNILLNYGKVCIVTYKWPPIQKKLIKLEFDAILNKITAIEHQFFKIQQFLMGSEFILKIYQIQIQITEISLISENFQKTLSMVDKKKLSYPKKLQIIDNLAKAIKHLSENKISHRNICPDWICIIQENQRSIYAKLHNFRSAMVIQNHKKLQFIQKNPRKLKKSKYTAPEIFQRQHDNSKCDVWSLGVIFYELIFDNTKGIKVQQGRVTLKFPQKTPNWLISIFKEILVWNPKQRCDIRYVIEILKPTLVCAETTEKCLADIGL